MHGQAIGRALVKDAGVQAAVGVVLRRGNGAGGNDRLLFIDVRVQLHLQYEVDVRLPAGVLQMDVDAPAVRRGGGCHVHIGAGGLIVAAHDPEHHRLVVGQTQGEVDVVVMIVDDLLQVGPQLIPKHHRIILRVGGGDGGVGVGLPVLGGVLRQHLVGLVRQLPGDEGVVCPV